MRKDAVEIAALSKAAEAIDRVHARMGEWLRPGRTEAEVGVDIAAAIVTEGHTAAEFVIVGSGPNGASPHHAVSDRVIGRGDVVVVDIGGPVAEGYCSDCTRTYAVGKPAHADVARTYMEVSIAVASPSQPCSFASASRSTRWAWISCASAEVERVKLIGTLQPEHQYEQR